MSMFSFKCLFLFAFVSCSAFKKAPEESVGDSAAPAADAGMIAVSQPARKTAAYPEKSPEFWIALRQDASKPNQQIEGMLGTGEAKTAADMARKRLEKSPGDVATLRILASALALQKNFDLAAYYADEVLKSDPQNGDALNIKGLAFLYTSQSPLEFKKAAAMFLAAHQAAGTQIAAGLNLGSLYLETGNAKQAENIFSEVKTRCNDCPAALMGYGIASSRAGSYDAAKGAFEKLMSKQPTNGVALFQLALVEKNGFNHKDIAEKHLQKILSDEKFKDPTLKQRANAVLRSMKAQGES